MAKKQSTRQLYNDIRVDFEKMNVMEFGVKKFTPNWIFAKLAKKYYKQPSTIEQIVFHRL